jgi:hypothetical protein
MILGQQAQKENADGRISLSSTRQGSLLERFAESLNGIQTVDAPRHVLSFWEPGKLCDVWNYHQSALEVEKYLTGRSCILRWEQGTGSLVREIREKLGANWLAWIRGREAWGNLGVVVSGMRKLSVGLYSGTSFDNNVSVLLPKNSEELASIWCSVLMLNTPN